MVQLASYPDCTDRYQGDNVRFAVYIAGRGDASLERLFLRKDVKEAGNYARSIRKSLVAYPAGALCAEAVESLLAG
jgi:hypothetical protein